MMPPRPICATESSDFLRCSIFQALRTLQVEVFDDTVVLDGHISSFHERQLAVAFCKRVAGGHKVIDRLIVSEAILHGQRGQRGQRGRESGTENEIRRARA